MVVELRRQIFIASAAPNESRATISVLRNESDHTKAQESDDKSAGSASDAGADDTERQALSVS